MAFTAVIALAFYQTVIAIARNESQSLGFWTGVLMTCAVGVLIMPIVAIPFIFGGIAAKPLALESKKALDVRKVWMLTPSRHNIVCHTGQSRSARAARAQRRLWHSAPSPLNPTTLVTAQWMSTALHGLEPPATMHTSHRRTSIRPSC